MRFINPAGRAARAGVPFVRPTPSPAAVAPSEHAGPTAYGGWGRRPRVDPAARSKSTKTLVARQPSRLDRRRPDVEGLRVAAPARAPI